MGNLISPYSSEAQSCGNAAGCPHYSESDRTLFGIDEDAANPQGYCLHASCYNAKHGAVEAAKEQIFKKINSRQDRTPEAIRKISPGWLKEATIVGYVKRQLEKAVASEGAKLASTPRQPPGRQLSDHALAVQKFAQTFYAWNEQAYTLILKGVNADPLHRVNWCVLLGVPAFWEQPGMEMQVVNLPNTETVEHEPVLLPLPEPIESAIRLAFKGTRNAWVEALEGI